MANLDAERSSSQTLPESAHGPSQIETNYHVPPPSFSDEKEKALASIAKEVPGLNE